MMKQSPPKAGMGEVAVSALTADVVPPAPPSLLSNWQSGGSEVGKARERGMGGEQNLEFSI